LNPKQFLLIGGIVLLALGLVGFAGLFSQMNSFFYLDNGENVAHTGLGIVAIAASYLLKDASLQKWLVVAVGVLALFFTVYGFVVAGNASPNTFGIANLESPADDILHLVVGVWALAAAFMGGRMGIPAKAM
jgi:CBS domain containing-hemolysin-like protein